MNVTVVGTGYVGLVTGTCLSEAGHTITCVDIDEKKVAQMQAGSIPIYEPGLEQLFKKNIERGHLKFTNDLASGLKGAKAVFLALPTPPGEDGAADLSYILGVAEQLGELLEEYTVVIDKSTVPVGTAIKVKQNISKNATVEFDVVSNPEFLREGHAVSDFQQPDRIVIGTSSEKAHAVMTELYASFVQADNPILFMDESSAEMTKYAANAFLATKISFMNQIANLCEIVGADVDHVREGIGSDSRIGKQFLFAGIGYGGSCFPKDVMALEHTATQHNYDFGMLKAVSAANREQKLQLTKKIDKYYGAQLTGKKFAIWGLAFKPDTDDIREAPALEIINDLIAKGAKIVAFDPEAMPNVKKVYSDNDNITFVDDMYDAIDGADALLIATEWPAFVNADHDRIKTSLRQPVIFDGRNIYNPRVMLEQDFHYESIGRPIITNGGNNNG